MYEGEFRYKEGASCFLIPFLVSFLSIHSFESHIPNGSWIACIINNINITLLTWILKQHTSLLAKALAI